LKLVDNTRKLEEASDALWVGCAGIRFGYASIWVFDKVLNL
jgi:hypothetical protein